MDIPPELAAILGEYQLKPGAMFPGMRDVTERLTKQLEDSIFEAAKKSTTTKTTKTKTTKPTKQSLTKPTVTEQKSKSGTRFKAA